MALPAATGTLDTELSIVTPTNTGTWAALSGTQWNEANSWITAPPDQMIWVTDLIQVPFTTPYNLRIETDAEGQVSYDVYTSSTGAFQGEETVTAIASGATSVASFTGAFCHVVVKVTRTSASQVLRNVRVVATDASVNMTFVTDTSTLSGTVGARVLTLPRAVSGIVTLVATPQAITAYTPNVYVTDISTTQLTHVILLDASHTTPTVGVFGFDGVAKDATIHVSIKALPQQQMQGNNLVTA